MERVSAATGIQGGMVRETSSRSRPVLPVQSALLRLRRTMVRNKRSVRQGVGLSCLRLCPRPGRERCEEYLERRFTSTGVSLYTVGRDTPEPNARGDHVRHACRQRSANREFPGFSRGECQICLRLPLPMVKAFPIRPHRKVGTVRRKVKLLPLPGPTPTAV